MSAQGAAWQDWPIVFDVHGKAWHVAPVPVYPAGIGPAPAGYSLPSPDMAIRIWEAADCQLDANQFVRSPRSSSPNDYGPRGMASPLVYADQRRRVDMAIAAWVQARGVQPLLVSGTHKDIVEADRDYRSQPTKTHPDGRLLLRKGQIGIFGWFQADGTPIQPISAAHKQGYTDYSQGMRYMMPAEWKG